MRERKALYQKEKLTETQVIERKFKEKKSQKERFTESKNTERKVRERVSVFQCLVTLECLLSSWQAQYLATAESHFFIVGAIFGEIGVLLFVAGSVLLNCPTSVL